MLFFRAILIASAVTIFSPPTFAEQLTIERLEASPGLNGPAIRGLKLSPDGSRITFLKGKQDNFRQQDLWEFDPETGESRLLVDSVALVATEELTEVEKQRRERQRIFASGIVEYYWNEAGNALLFPLGGDLYYLPLGGEVRQLTATDAFETDPRFSPRGNYVSFIRDQNLFVIEIAAGKEKKLTRDGGGLISNGMAEFVAQEEIDRNTGYWWAPDESRIAFTRINESPVVEAKRYEYGADGVKVVEQRYPFAGTDNVLIQLGVVGIGDGKIRWFDLGDNPDIYLARVNWLNDSKTVAYQRQSRDQKSLDLIFADAKNGKQKTILTETSETWINLHDDLKFLKDGKRFIWASERDGFNHLYLYDLEGKLIRQLTKGDWVVGRLRMADEKNGLVYFEGFADTPLQRQLYSVSMEGGDPRRVTPDAGSHSTTVAADARYFIDNYSSTTTPPRVVLRSMDGKVMSYLEENPLDGSHPYARYLDSHLTPEFGSIEAEDGTPLYYYMIKPAGFDPAKKYPAIVSVYGGPGAQTVRNGWSVNFNQILAQQGYVVFQLDNRGSANRGVAFEAPLYHAMGEVEVRDQRTGVEFLKSRSFVDADRIGVSGWSYGGYMTLNLMFKAGDLFAAGVAGAPVTDWRLYDTHYTERFLGHPDAPGDVYTKTSVFDDIDGLQDPLIIIHGMADDNVVFSNTVNLAAILQQKRLPFEMMTYPGKRHRITGEGERIHLNKTILNFFDRHLK